MIKKMYHWLLQKSAKPDDRGGISAGYWQGKIRGIAVDGLRSTSGRVLDIGCGEGLFLRDAMKACPDARLFGIDFTMSQLILARKRTLHGAYAQADAFKLPFKDNSFNNVVAINIIINMSGMGDVDNLLHELHRVSKPGGSILFDIRNSLNPIIWLKYKLAPFYDGTVRAKNLSLISCDPRIIEKTLEGVGFKVCGKTAIGFPSGKLAPVLIYEATKVR